jgi:type IV pilus assembly protein PilE
MNHLKNPGKGFTLIELLVVLGIIAILASFAYPSYREYVMRAKRSEAHNLLLDVANRQERYYANNNTYAPDLATLGFTVPLKSEHNYYRINMNVPGGGGAAYSLVATAINEQAADTHCKKIRYNALGRKWGTNSDCWGS